MKDVPPREARRRAGGPPVVRPGPARRLLRPAAGLLGVVALGLVATRGLSPDAPALAVAQPVVVAAVAGVPAPDALAPGPLAALMPAPDRFGADWVLDADTASGEPVDGVGLVHPCRATYKSDAARGETQRLGLTQQVPVGSAMTVELARYATGGAAAAVADVRTALQGCTSYSTEFVGYPATVDVALLNPPAGSDGAAAHLAVTVDAGPGPQVLEYTLLVARQGDVLVSALVGNGNGSGTDLDEFAERHVDVVRRAVAGMPWQDPEPVRPAADAADPGPGAVDPVTGEVGP